MPEEREYQELQLEYSLDSDMKQTTTITNDELPEYILMSNDLWQALHDANGPWCWLSDSTDVEDRTPLPLDHGTTLDGDTQWWAHFNATNVYALYAVLGRHDEHTVALHLEKWTRKAGH